jgi:hypothetical protein
MVMRQLAFLRADMLAAGKTEADFEKAALGLVEELLPILVDHMERRTGQRVVGAFGHFDSGFFHLGFWLTRVGENLRQIGVAQLGLTGRVNIGWHSQVTAGYKLPSGAAEKYARHMALMRDRYKPGSEQAKAALGRGAKFDGMAVDLGLSDRLMKFFREEAAPVVGYWARGCEVYRAYLEATEPQKEAKRGEKKMLREQVTRALLAEGEKVGLKARELALETQRRQVQVALEKGLAASGLADEPLRSGIREVTGEFALNRLVEAVISGQLDLIVLWEQAKAGVEALLEWLRNLFKVESPELSKPVEKAPEVPVVHADRLAEEWELSWLEELEGYPTAPVGEELALVVANVKRGLWGGSGLSESQRNIVAVQMVELQLWIEAEAARRLVPPTPPPPTPVEKTQDIGVVGASEIAFDETPARPAAEAKFRELLEFVPESWRKGVAPEAMPAREAGVERRVRLLSRLLVENRLGDFSGRRRGGVCSAEMKARWMLADLPFPRFEQACWKIVGGMPIDEAREFVEREEMPK